MSTVHAAGNGALLAEIAQLQGKTIRRGDLNRLVDSAGIESQPDSTAATMISDAFVTAKDHGRTTHRADDRFEQLVKQGVLNSAKATNASFDEGA